MSAVKFMKRMLDAGFSLEDAMKAATIFEEEVLSSRLSPAQTSGRTARQERNRRYYEARKGSAASDEASEKRLKTSENKTRASETSEQDDPSPSLPPSPQTPQPPTHPPVEKTTRVRAAKRAPEDWAPSAKTLTTLEAEGYSPGQIERELTMIRDHTFANARSDWDASFRNWVRKKPPTNKPAKPNGLFDDRPDPRSTQRTDRLDRMLAGALDAVDQQS